MEITFDDNYLDTSVFSDYATTQYDTDNYYTDDAVYATNTEANEVSSFLLGGLFGALSISIIIGVILISLATSILSIVALWKIFTKANKPGWASIIPFYNFWILFEIVGFKGWYALFMLIPPVGAILTIVAYFKLAKCFGKDTGFGIGLVLLTLIFTCILAFDKSTYIEPELA